MPALAARQFDPGDSRVWNIDRFIEFYMTRPDGERWQLVDGLGMMVAPPTFAHQRIVSNLQSLLEEALEGQPFETIHRFLVCVPGLSDFCAAPDLIVTSQAVDDAYVTDSFILTAEVSSEFDPHEMIVRKLELYQSHADSLYCLTIDQDSVHVSLFVREKGWARVDLRSLDDVLRLPSFGFETTLADIYKGTPLGR
jgi:hypothetical protein